MNKEKYYNKPLRNYAFLLWMNIKWLLNTLYYRIYDFLEKKLLNKHKAISKFLINNKEELVKRIQYLEDAKNGNKKRQYEFDRDLRDLSKEDYREDHKPKNQQEKELINDLDFVKSLIYDYKNWVISYF